MHPVMVAGVVLVCDGEVLVANADGIRAEAAIRTEVQEQAEEVARRVALGQIRS